MPTFVGKLLVGIQNLLNKRQVLIVLTVLIIATVGIIVLLLINKKQGATQVKKCTKVGLPLAKGFQTWQFSYGGGPGKGPQISTATIDTLTPPMGSTQTLTLKIKGDSPLTTVNAMVYTDNKNIAHSLNLDKGTVTDGIWAGTWKLDDTTECVYHIDFDLQSSTGNWTGALTFR